MSTTTLHISLSETLKEFTLRRVEEGAFSNPSDYIRTLIRADRDRQKLEELRYNIQVGIDELDRGEGIHGDEEFQHLEEKFDHPG